MMYLTGINHIQTPATEYVTATEARNLPSAIVEWHCIKTTTARVLIKLANKLQEGRC